MSASQPVPPRLPGISGRYSGVRLHCHKCGILKLTVQQLYGLALWRPGSSPMPRVRFKC
jgi:hypothetical protein